MLIACFHAPIHIHRSLMWSVPPQIKNWAAAYRIRSLRWRRWKFDLWGHVGAHPKLRLVDQKVGMNDKPLFTDTDTPTMKVYGGAIRHYSGGRS